MIENQRTIFLGYGTNIRQVLFSMQILYQNFDGEKSIIGNIPTNSSELLFAEAVDN